jgi:hypothetical protein
MEDYDEEDEDGSDSENEDNAAMSGSYDEVSILLNLILLPVL